MSTESFPVAVAGATGTAGTQIRRQAELQGRGVVPLTRGHGVDLLTGEGLAGKLIEAAVVIDASDPRTPDLAPVDALTRATQHLLDACAGQHIQHLVLLSINGIDHAGFDDFPFYRAKRVQEQMVRESGVPHTIVRSTQWYEFALNPVVTRQEDDLVAVQDWAIQPVAVSSVGAFLLDTALGPARNQTVVIAGPQRLRLPELTMACLRAEGDQRRIVTVEAAMPAMSSGLLYAPEDATILAPDLEQWLLMR